MWLLPCVDRWCRRAVWGARSLTWDGATSAGFIAHVHIESAMVPPREFARAVVPHGVTTVVTDPHEIANVLGLEGIRFMLDDARYGPLNMYVNASSRPLPTWRRPAPTEFYDLRLCCMSRG
jgi:hypothetical protein